MVADCINPRKMYSSSTPVNIIRIKPAITTSTHVTSAASGPGFQDHVFHEPQSKTDQTDPELLRPNSPGPADTAPPQICDPAGDKRREEEQYTDYHVPINKGQADFLQRQGQAYDANKRRDRQEDEESAQYSAMDHRTVDEQHHQNQTMKNHPELRFHQGGDRLGDGNHDQVR